jgi:3'-phosphoadenosine 5'-phosphosulfate synthase
MNQGDYLVSGKSMRFFKTEFGDGMDQFRLSPEQIEAEVASKKGDAVFCLQLDEPLHKSHIILIEIIRNSIIEQGYKNPILLLHPRDISSELPLSVLFRQLAFHLDGGHLDGGHLDPATTILAIAPSVSLLAGPVEDLWQLSSRLNAGVTHFLL